MCARMHACTHGHTIMHLRTHPYTSVNRSNETTLNYEWSTTVDVYLHQAIDNVIWSATVDVYLHQAIDNANCHCPRGCFKLFTFVITQRSSATIHLAKKDDNNRQKRTYISDKENEVGQPGEGEENCDDDQHLYNPRPIVRYEWWRQTSCRLTSLPYDERDKTVIATEDKCLRYHIRCIG